jgi:hypothetical protein
MERLSGKILVDTYSKRSQTLIEKASTSLDLIPGFFLTRNMCSAKNWNN